MENSVMRLKEWTDSASRIVFFGGAGVSTESGIPDFRGSGGLYTRREQIPPEEIISHGFFVRHTAQFYEFYRRCMLYPDAQPNAAHRKLAEWEAQGKLLAVITQNIDGLHQKAGSKRVYELHGSVLRNTCMKCGRRYGLEAVIEGGDVPRCECGGLIKPDVVLYGENLDMDVMEGAIDAIRQCDLFIIGGTSLTVWPAAGLIDYAAGKRVCLINRDPTPMDGRAGLVIHEGIAGVMKCL